MINRIRWWKKEVWTSIFRKRTGLWCKVNKATANMVQHLLIFMEQLHEMQTLCQHSRKTHFVGTKWIFCGLRLLSLRMSLFFLHLFLENHCMLIHVCGCIIHIACFCMKDTSPDFPLLSSNHVIWSFRIFDNFDLW